MMSCLRLLRRCRREGAWDAHDKRFGKDAMDHLDEHTRALVSAGRWVDTETRWALNKWLTSLWSGNPVDQCDLSVEECRILLGFANAFTVRRALEKSSDEHLKQHKHRGYKEHEGVMFVSGSLLLKTALRSGKGKGADYRLVAEGILRDYVALREGKRKQRDWEDERSVRRLQQPYRQQQQQLTAAGTVAQHQPQVQMVPQIAQGRGMQASQPRCNQGLMQSGQLNRQGRGMQAGQPRCNQGLMQSGQLNRQGRGMQAGQPRYNQWQAGQGGGMQVGQRFNGQLGLGPVNIQQQAGGVPLGGGEQPEVQAVLPGLEGWDLEAELEVGVQFAQGGEQPELEGGVPRTQQGGDQPEQPTQPHNVPLELDPRLSAEDRRKWYREHGFTTEDVWKGLVQASDKFEEEQHEREQALRQVRQLKLQQGVVPTPPLELGPSVTELFNWFKVQGYTYQDSPR
ncbi:hypothetical protein KFL_006340190 [Klebsormidium nitens]|uniref:Uncharacterized protein n=1 Tax=Klebsormidium nitens TaxID=105231 RepID=A0A1Y1IMM8_KLENI|nr:hypothetical protein KFL_006340190 [Klebsormidium nitens]|eukprot:GAQ90401.1 hypothetical protein KFL_006340190 [Klebsormidium nitens]